MGAIMQDAGNLELPILFTVRFWPPIQSLVIKDPGQDHNEQEMPTLVHPETSGRCSAWSDCCNTMS